MGSTPMRPTTVKKIITSVGLGVTNTGQFSPVDQKAENQTVQLLQLATDRRRGG